jgi:apolipoprotein D and lipocalin family protein
MFDLAKYMGTWYELMHYPSFFQRNDNYNTMAEYRLVNNVVQIKNSTIVQGKTISSQGTGKLIYDYQLRVDFDLAEVNKLAKTGQFKQKTNDITGPNYVIYKLWMDVNDNYIYAVISDPTKSTLYVLSRTPSPPLEDYNFIMTYIVNNFDRDKLVQTPHFF